MKTPEEKALIRAVLLCKQKSFHDYLAKNYKLAHENLFHGSLIDENIAKNFLCHLCSIKSRSEITTNPEGFDRFKMLDSHYLAWHKPTIDDEYAEYLDRY